jgi:hypothetical protein
VIFCVRLRAQQVSEKLYYFCEPFWPTAMCFPASHGARLEPPPRTALFDAFPLVRRSFVMVGASLNIESTFVMFMLLEEFESRGSVHEL